MRIRTVYLLVAALCAAIGAAVFVPDLRLSSELAAARREGLWTSAADVRRAIGTVRPEDNAAPRLWAAITQDRAERGSLLGYRELMRVADGKATSTEREAAQRALPKLRGLLARWRAASARPRLDYGRRYEDGYRVLFPELAPLRAGAMRLVAAAALDESPRANLLAAARLSALVRQEPGTIQQLVGMTIGKAALREANHRGIGPEVASALGPDADVRRILGPDLPGLLDAYSLSDYEAALSDLGVRHSLGFAERLAHWGPLAKSAKASGVAHWRRLWARLPKDGTDLDAAAVAVDAEMPAIDALTPTIAEVTARLSSTGGGRGDILRDIARFELDRKRALVPRATP